MMNQIIKYEDCKHNLERKSLGFYSCQCGSHRYFPFQAVQNLIGLYKFERGAGKKYALELIIEQYGNSTTEGNKSLAEIAKERLRREFN